MRGILRTKLNILVCYLMPQGGNYTELLCMSMLYINGYVYMRLKA